jgi:peptidoglycan/LPS O-acetylase OafA/YrhL
LIRERSSDRVMSGGQRLKHYRPDIDGLRAVAVLPVVLFHAHVVGFGGGYVGVDIFFVISGYLISLILLRSLDRDAFRITTFYERRIRRILPALAAMALVATAAAIWLLPPRELQAFGRSLQATALFYSNFHFATLTGYFDAPASTRPLLHTWSLGVEEQFYIVWPIALYLAYRLKLGRKTLIILVSLLLVASLSIAEWKSDGPSSARYFFLPQSRAWELMIGALLALGAFPQILSKWQRDVAGLAGLAMIAVAVTLFSESTPFPSVWALVPCGGAALVIWAGASGDNIASRILSMPPLVFVGLISYSLYLWHWPVFVFAGIYAQRTLTLPEAFALIALSLVLATLSWKLIEQPFRRRREGGASPKPYLIGGVCAIVAMAAVGLGLNASAGLPGRLDAQTLRFEQASRAINPLRKQCHTEGDVPRPAAFCTVPPSKDRNYDILVWGDSHADAFFPAIRIVAERSGLSARQASKSGCPPLLGADRVDRRRDTASVHNCKQYNQAMLDQLREQRPKLVVLAGRWSLFTAPRSGQASFIVDSDGAELTVEASRRALKRSLERTVDAITKLGIPVLLIGQAPEIHRNPNVCYVRNRMLGKSVEPCIRQAVADAEALLGTSNDILTAIAATRPKVRLLRLDTLFCEGGTCSAVRDGEPLYNDWSHISRYAAPPIAESLLSPAYNELFAPGPVDQRPD